MSDQARGIIFVIVVVAITFVWVKFFQPPQKPAQSVSQSAPAQPGASGASATTLAGGAGPAATAPAPAAAVAIPTVEASIEKSAVVESGLYRVEFSNRGAVVRSWRLKKYFDDQKIPQPLELVNQSAAQQLGWPFSLVLADKQFESEANEALYEITPEADSGGTARLTAPADVAFHWSNGHLDVTKKIHFKQDYEASLDVTASLDGKPLAAALAWRGGFGDQEVYKGSQLVSVYYKQNDKLNLLQYKKLGVPNNQAQPLEVTGPMQFTGIEDQFFTAAFLPEGTNLSLWHWTQDHSISGGTEPEAEMAAGTADPGPLQARIYVGPKDLVLLDHEKPPLEELVNFGWFGVIAKPLLFILQWIHTFIPNYGWAIVAITLALTLLLAPLRIWSFRSARKMQAVGPEIKSIQDRYKKYSMSDPRKRQMNEEVMAVYAREGINPASGCLPMLPQLPLLWAFYRMLAGAIELRHAPWIFWIHDLSAKDPYYILPIAMVLTSYLMTKMTPMPTGGDPSQQKMMMLMPVVMGFIFFNLSSGLNLYYFTSNLVGVAQQFYLNKHNPLPSRSKFKNKKKE